MKTRFSAILPLLSVSFLALAVAPAASGQLYNNTNPPPNYDLGAYSINLGFTVTNSFTLTDNSTITGVSFVAVTDSGDTVNSVDWSILGGMDGTTVEDSGTASALGNSSLGTTSLGTVNTYDVFQESFSISPYVLASGPTYYLELSNAVASNSPDDPVYWNQSNGASTVQLSSGSATGSESFEILGEVGGTPSGTPGDPGTPANSDVPEGNSYGYLLLSGLALLGCGMFRSRLTGK